MRQSSLVKKLALFDFLDADDSSGQPIVRSAAECLTEVHYAGGLHALRSSLLYGKGLPVVWRDAHLDVTPLTDKAANTFVTRCMPDQATAFHSFCSGTCLFTLVATAGGQGRTCPCI